MSRPTFISAVFYKDPKAAHRFLEAAFGFELTMLIESPDGDLNMMHSEMSFGAGLIMVGAEWSDSIRSPRSVGGVNTQNLHVTIDNDIDAHCERARAAGAVILMEPEDQFYGDRTYRAVDPEGHIWSFGQTVREVAREEAEQASGLKIEGWV